MHNKQGEIRFHYYSIIIIIIDRQCSVYIYRSRWLRRFDQIINLTWWIIRFDVRQTNHRRKRILDMCLVSVRYSVYSCWVEWFGLRRFLGWWTSRLSFSISGFCLQIENDAMREEWEKNNATTTSNRSGFPGGCLR